MLCLRGGWGSIEYVNLCNETTGSRLDWFTMNYEVICWPQPRWEIQLERKQGSPQKKNKWSKQRSEVTLHNLIEGVTPWISPPMTRQSLNWPCAKANKNYWILHKQSVSLQKVWRINTCVCHQKIYKCLPPRMAEEITKNKHSTAHYKNPISRHHPMQTSIDCFFIKT